jgi:bloom syndrome protein
MAPETVPSAAPMSEYQQTFDRSYRNLAEARAAAYKKRQYNSQQTRAGLQAAFTKKFRKPAYEWQLDATESILLGLDCILVAGTGSGKTIPFMLPLLTDKTKKIIVVSPLKVLQRDQVRYYLTQSWSLDAHYVCIRRRIDSGRWASKPRR